MRSSLTEDLVSQEQKASRIATLVTDLACDNFTLAVLTEKFRMDMKFICYRSLETLMKSKSHFVVFASKLNIIYHEQFLLFTFHISMYVAS